MTMHNPWDRRAKKMVVRDGRPMGEERAAWAGLDQLGEVEVYECQATEG